MAQDFAQHFVDLPRRGLGTEPFTELALNHAECRLDVRAPMIPLHESLLVLSVEVIHVLPHGKLPLVGFASKPPPAS